MNSCTVRLAPTVVACWLLLAACADSPSDPQQRLRDLIRDAAAAAENRDVATLKGFVADGYRDAAGRDRRAVIRLAQAYLMRHGAVHLYTVVKEIALEPAGRARALVYVAMAGRPIDTLEALEQVRADLVRFDIDFVGDGSDWLVAAASWRRASPADFF